MIAVVADDFTRRLQMAFEVVPPEEEEALMKSTED